MVRQMKKNYDDMRSFYKNTISEYIPEMLDIYLPLFDNLKATEEDYKLLIYVAYNPHILKYSHDYFKKQAREKIKDYTSADFDYCILDIKRLTGYSISYNNNHITIQ